MRLHCAYLLEELQRIQGAGHLAQFDFGGLRNALGLQEPITGGLRQMVSFGHLSALTMLLHQLE